MPFAGVGQNEKSLTWSLGLVRIIGILIDKCLEPSAQPNRSVKQNIERIYGTQD